MSRKNRKLNERLDVTMSKGIEKFIGFQIEAEWENVAVPHHLLLIEISRHLPDLLGLAPEPHEVRRTFSWAKSRVQVDEKVRLQRVSSKKGFVTLQPHLVIDKKNDSSTDARYDHELETDNMPRVALRLNDETIIAEDPSHQVAVAMAQTFADLKDKMHTEDLRTFVTRIVRRLGGIKKLKATSIWFVPWTEEATRVLPALQEIVRACEAYASDADLYVTKMPRSETDDVRCATKSAQRTFASEYRAVFNQIEGFISNMFAGDVTQNASLKERLKLSKFLRERAELYQELLDLRSENMTKALEVIEEATEVLIDGAGEYRASIKAAKKLDDKSREKEETSAKTDLATWAEEAEKLMGKCRDILDPKGELWTKDLVQKFRMR